MKAPILSVIIPVFNAAKTISRIVEKILTAKFRNLELILIDDGSTDNSLKILRDCAKNDTRIKIISQPNAGPAAARNAGLAKIRGEFVMFVDADDDFAPEIFANLTREIRDKKSDLVVCSFARIDSQKRDEQVFENREIRGENRETYLVEILKSLGENGALYNIWGKIYRAEIIRDNHLHFRGDLRFGEDLLFNLDYYKFAYKINFMSDILYFYHVGRGEFSRHALNFAFREINRDGLENFVGRQTSREISDLTNWLLYRWLISFVMLLAGSRLPYREKLTLAKKLRAEKLTRATDAKFIGVRKLRMEKWFDVLRRYPLILLNIFGWAAIAKKWPLVKKLRGV